MTLHKFFKFLQVSTRTNQDKPHVTNVTRERIRTRPDKLAVWIVLLEQLSTKQDKLLVLIVDLDSSLINLNRYNMLSVIIDREILSRLVVQLSDLWYFKKYEGNSKTRP